jgi:hypothetical protein
MENYQVQFRDLLKRAVSEPGTISAAYSAFHDYSIDNQLAADCSWWMNAPDRASLPAEVSIWPSGFKATVSTNPCDLARLAYRAYGLPPPRKSPVHPSGCNFVYTMYLKVDTSASENSASSKQYAFKSRVSELVLSNI